MIWWHRHSCLCLAEGENTVFNEPQLHIHRRNLPHWTLEGSTYFITFRVKSVELPMVERLIVLEHIKAGAERFYELFAAVVMPDHGHVLLRPVAGTELARITKGIKGVSANLLNRHRGTSGSIWQDESFDRIVRDAKEFEEKLQYIIGNPVKKQLVVDPFEYDALYVGPES